MSISPETALVIGRFPCGPFRTQAEVRQAVADVLVPEPVVALSDADELLRTAAAESFLDRVDWAEAFLALGTIA
jgi:hypothetical protein